MSWEALHTGLAIFLSFGAEPCGKCVHGGLWGVRPGPGLPSPEAEAQEVGEPPGSGGHRHLESVQRLQGAWGELPTPRVGLGTGCPVPPSSSRLPLAPHPVQCGPRINTQGAATGVHSNTELGLGTSTAGGQAGPARTASGSSGDNSGGPPPSPAMPAGPVCPPGGG